MSLREDFERDGYVIIEDAIPFKTVCDFEVAFLQLAEKLMREDGIDPSDLTEYELLEKLYTNHLDKFYKLGSNIGSSIAGWKMFASQNFQTALNELFGERQINSMFPYPWNVFYNRKEGNRLRYTLHQESVALTTVKTAYHIWTPLFRDLELADGPMVVLKGSHKKLFPYITEKVPNGITQLHIPPELIEEYERVHCTFNRGTVIIFHNNLVHGSGTNLTDFPRIACATRLHALMDEEVFEPYVRYYFTSEESRKGVEAKVVLKNEAV